MKIVVSGYMHLARRSWVVLFPTVFILRNTRTHISTLNGSDILSNIEAAVDSSLGFGITLQILDINLNNKYIWLLY